MDLISRPPVKPEHEVSQWDPDDEQQSGIAEEETFSTQTGYTKPAETVFNSIGMNVSEISKGIGQLFAAGVHKESNTVMNKKEKVEGVLKRNKGEVDDSELTEADRIGTGEEPRDTSKAPSAAVPTVEETVVSRSNSLVPPETMPSQTFKDEHTHQEKSPRFSMLSTSNGDAHDTLSARARKLSEAANRKRNQSVSMKLSPYAVPTPAPEVDPLGFVDPLDDKFYLDTWCAVASRNTQIFRKVFRCTPDDLCMTWSQFREVGSFTFLSLPSYNDC